MRAQLRMFESTMVMFVLFFMIVIGLVIYSNYQENKMDQLENEFDQVQAAAKARKVATIAEIQCTSNAATRHNCIQIQKLQPFIDTVNANPRYYRQMFGPSKVTVELVYAPSFGGGLSPPAFFTDTSGNLDKNPKELFDFSAGSQEADTFNYPVLFKDSQSIPGRNYFGWLTVEVYR